MNSTARPSTPIISFACDSDVVDATAAFTMAHDKFANHFDVAQMLDTRERRRITGEIELQPMDFFAHRRYRDTIVHLPAATSTPTALSSTRCSC